MDEEEKFHWKQHLHFVPNKCDSHNQEFVDAVCDVRSISIDRFQRWREIGYLGNPANFSGTYISYLSHEATYFNYEFEALYEPDVDYDEITVFPIAIPFIAGPATLATIILLIGNYASLPEFHIIVIIALIAALLVSLLLMIGGSYIVKFLPKQFLHTTARVMAFILAALATQFIIDGIKASFNS